MCTTAVCRRTCCHLVYDSLYDGSQTEVAVVAIMHTAVIHTVVIHTECMMAPNANRLGLLQAIVAASFRAPVI